MKRRSWLATSNHPICISRSLGIDQLDGCSLRPRRWKKERKNETGTLCSRLVRQSEKRTKAGGGQTKWGRQEIGRAVFVGRTEFGEWHHKSPEFQRCIARVARGPGDASLSPWAPGGSARRLLRAYPRDRFRFCLRACVVTSGVRIGSWQPRCSSSLGCIQRASSVPRVLILQLLFALLRPSRYAAHGGPSLSVFTFSAPSDYVQLASLSLVSGSEILSKLRVSPSRR